MLEACDRLAILVSGICGKQLMSFEFTVRVCFDPVCIYSAPSTLCKDVGRE